MRLRVILSLSVVASSALAGSHLRAETELAPVPPAPAAQADYDGVEPELTTVAEVFQPGTGSIEEEQNPQPEGSLNPEETEDEIIFDDPAPVKPPADPYKGLFFDNTFSSYLSNPDHPYLLGER
ncbi:MAG: hypothetical protein KDA74_09525, partial [Planctomycetaceae bacterium]|nr:hypothetical protein [Planctomycetaceae bacterium]